MNSRELVTLDKLLSQTAQQPDTVEKTVAQALTSPFVQMVNLLQNISIYDFFAPAFNKRSRLMRIRRKSIIDEDAMEAMYNRLESYIRILIPDASIKTMSVRKLANRICDGVDREELPLHKRMEWYELCFVLIAGMSNPARYDGDICRVGAPGLTARLCLRPDKNCKGNGLVSIEALLESMSGLNMVLPPSYTNRKLDDFVLEWTLAKNGLDDPAEAMNITGAMAKTRFESSAERYGLPFSDDIGVGTYMSRLASQLVEKVDGGDPPVEVMKLYELCYETVSLMADDDRGHQHQTLMVIRGLECDELEEIVAQLFADAEDSN